MPVSPGQILKPLVRIGKSPDECWRWLGAKNHKGYGVKEWLGKSQPAARWLWTQLFGPIPDDMIVSPSCGNASCVNPHHLHLLTVAECNQQAHSGLTAQDVAQIRLLHENGAPAASLSRRFMVDETTIFRIVRRSTWRNVGKARKEACEAAA